MEIIIENEYLEKLIEKLKTVGFEFKGCQRLFAQNVYEFDTSYYKKDEQIAMKNKLESEGVTVFNVTELNTNNKKIAVFTLGMEPEIKDERD